MAEDTQKLRAFSGEAKRRRFGPYETLFRIAGGGMAEVYAARISGEGGFQKVVALKRMLPTLAEDERFVTMFLDEGRLAANISSPNVVSTLDLGRASDDSLYLVMELVVGVPLSRLLREVLGSGHYLPHSVAVEILAQAAQGLHDAHEATTPIGDPMKLIHRDVSPQNILIDRHGQTRITDFGVARALQRHSHTQSGEVKGKMSYFAPEQAGAKELDRRVDVFALGIVAWETFAGRRLFKAENPLQILQKILKEPVPTLLEVRPKIPVAISKCVERALQKDPEDRYNTCAEFAHALRNSFDDVASVIEVGEYIRARGGKSLDYLENSLKTALSQEGAPDEVQTLVEDTGEHSEVSIPIAVKTENRFVVPALMVALFTAVALIGGLGFKMYSSQNSQTAVELPEKKEPTEPEETPKPAEAAASPKPEDPKEPAALPQPTPMVPETVATAEEPTAASMKRGRRRRPFKKATPPVETMAVVMMEAETMKTVKAVTMMEATSTEMKPVKMGGILGGTDSFLKEIGGK